MQRKWKNSNGGFGMFYGRYNKRLCNFILVGLLSIFTINQTHGQIIYPSQYGLGDVIFIAKLERLIEKLIKSQGKGDSKKTIQYLVEIKREIQMAYGIEFDIGKCLKEVEKEFKKLGQVLPSSATKIIKDKVKKEEKKQNKRLCDVQQIMEMENISFEDAQLYLLGSNEYKKEDKTEEEKDLPTLLICGVVMSLCGIFLYSLPIPLCKEWGQNLIIGGFTTCVTVLSNEHDENKKKDEENKKEDKE